jgi:hypothetical protein
MNLTTETRDYKLKDGVLNLVKDFQQFMRQVQLHDYNLQEIGEPKNWNKSFQECMELPESTLEQQLNKYKQIASIAQNFEQTGTYRGCTKKSFLDFNDIKGLYQALCNF